MPDNPPPAQAQMPMMQQVPMQQMPAGTGQAAAASVNPGQSPPQQ